MLNRPYTEVKDVFQDIFSRPLPNDPPERSPFFSEEEEPIDQTRYWYMQQAYEAFPARARRKIRRLA